MKTFYATSYSWVYRFPFIKKGKKKKRKIPTNTIHKKIRLSKVKLLIVAQFT